MPSPSNLLQLANDAASIINDEAKNDNSSTKSHYSSNATSQSIFGDAISGDDSTLDANNNAPHHNNTAASVEDKRTSNASAAFKTNQNVNTDDQLSLCNQIHRKYGLHTQQNSKHTILIECTQNIVSALKRESGQSGGGGINDDCVWVWALLVVLEIILVDGVICADGESEYCTRQEAVNIVQSKKFWKKMIEANANMITNKSKKINRKSCDKYKNSSAISQLVQSTVNNASQFSERLRVLAWLKSCLVTGTLAVQLSGFSDTNCSRMVGLHHFYGKDAFVRADCWERWLAMISECFPEISIVENDAFNVISGDIADDTCDDGVVVESVHKTIQFNLVVREEDCIWQTQHKCMNDSKNRHGLKPNKNCYLEDPQLFDFQKGDINWPLLGINLPCPSKDDWMQPKDNGQDEEDPSSKSPPSSTAIISKLQSQAERAQNQSHYYRQEYTKSRTNLAKQATIIEEQAENIRNLKALVERGRERERALEDVCESLQRQLADAHRL